MRHSPAGRLSQRCVRAVDAVGSLDHGALETAGLHRQVFRKEARDGGARRGIGPILCDPLRRERFLRQERTPGRECEQPQVRSRAGPRRREVVVLATQHPIGRALQ